MAIPLLLHVANASQALPLIAIAAVGGRHPPVPYRRIAVWSAVLLLSDMLDLAVSSGGSSNWWTSYFMLPVEVGLTCWVLAGWQATAQWRRAYLLAPAVLGGAVAFLLVLTDPAQTFDVWIAPLLALAALAGCLHTLVTSSLTSHEPLGRLDSFWICIGLAIFWTVQISAPAVVMAFLGTHIDWVRTVLLARAGLMVVGFLLITWGIVCRRVLPH